MTKNPPSITLTPLITTHTHSPPIPRTPYPWIWRCHKCRTIYRFSALHRCLSCSHRFCPKCISEFDYSGWENWRAYWHGAAAADGEAAEEEEEVEGAQGLDLWAGFEQIGVEVKVETKTTTTTTTTTAAAAAAAVREAAEGSDESAETDDGDDDSDDEWRPTVYYLQRGRSNSVKEARERLYPGCDGSYGNGEEGETMRDWSVGGEEEEEAVWSPGGRF